MSKEVSTKRFVLVLRDGARFFLDEKEAELVKKAIIGGSDYLVVGESVISKFDFSRLVSSDSYLEAEKIRAGMWKCSYNFWHEKGMGCGHRKGDKQ